MMMWMVGLFAEFEREVILDRFKRGPAIRVKAPIVLSSWHARLSQFPRGSPLYSIVD
jgi:hypothetical protein